MYLPYPFLTDIYEHVCDSDCTFPALKVGDQAAILLPNKRSAGYNWTLDVTNSLVEIVGERNEKIARDVVCTGGVTKFQFRTIMAGTAHLEFVFQKSSSGDVAKRIKVRIPVKWNKRGFKR